MTAPDPLDPEAAAEWFAASAAAYHRVADVEARAEMAALVLLAAHALQVAPTATHMLLESSDQGRHMCPPHRLTDDTGERVAKEEWDAHYEEVYDDLSDAAAWLTWEHESWEKYTDLDHRYTNTRGGYYALDLRRIVADVTTGGATGAPQEGA